jgi:hypothetical protein
LSAFAEVYGSITDALGDVLPKGDDREHGREGTSPTPIGPVDARSVDVDARSVDE